MKLVLHAAFAVANFIIIKRALSDSEHESESEEEYYRSSEYGEKVAINVMLNLTFVALIDIVFTDGSKRTCTGTIIHDNVVITAAHCFLRPHNKYIKPEVTATFVTIGSKKMFETGYEQYLPIERIVVHPKSKGWTADLALVYTFADMMSDRPGTVVPLASEKMLTQSRLNVTILSWGQCKLNYDSKEKDWRDATYPLRANTPLFSSTEEESPRIPTKRQRYRSRTRLQKIKRFSSKTTREYRDDIIRGATSNLYSAGMSSAEDTDGDSRNKKSRIRKSFEPSQQTQKVNYEAYFKNWRRSMGPKQNNLTVEVFGFVNMQACKKMIDRSVVEKYKLKNPNEFVCYSSEDHYITDEDAGAPAIRHGRLVAVTVSGVECDGEHVAIGIKISCFCSWIVRNLPSHSDTMKCCSNCCDINPEEHGKEENLSGLQKRKRKRS